MDLVAPQGVGPSWTRDRTSVPALQGRFLTTGQPEKRFQLFLILEFPSDFFFMDSRPLVKFSILLFVSRMF